MGGCTAVEDNSAIFFKNGYIIVNLNIETIWNADLQNPHLCLAAMISVHKYRIK